jgi:3-hydroxyacyl-CoA dehydrogenase
MINEAAFIKMEGVSDIAGIDAAMKLGANHPMGPLELGDFIGLDICLAIMDVLYNETGDIYLVADVLGHSSVDTTRKHYADMTDARRRMAAEHVHLPGDPDFPKGTVENSPMNGMKDQNDNKHQST